MYRFPYLPLSLSLSQTYSHPLVISRSLSRFVAVWFFRDFLRDFFIIFYYARDIRLSVFFFFFFLTVRQSRSTIHAITRTKFIKLITKTNVYRDIYNAKTITDILTRKSNLASHLNLSIRKNITIFFLIYFTLFRTFSFFLLFNGCV